MASSKKLTTSLTPGDEEAYVNQEIKRIQKDDQIQEIDLNKEPKPEEDKPDVEDPDRDRKLDKTVASALAKKEGTEKKKKKMVMDYEDDSKETKELLRRWKKPTKQTIVNAGTVAECSSAIRKQLTESDVSGERMVLSRSQVEKHFLPLLHESEIPRGKEGIEVPVYGPGGKVHKMKMWGYDDNKTQVATGWKKFVQHYQLKEICDFITIWMFRNQHNQICFAIDCTRLSLRNQVSKRISKEFDKSDEERGA